MSHSALNSNSNPEEKSQSWFKDVGPQAFRTTCVILPYLILSVGLTFYQRHLLKDFRFPLFVVIVHLVIKFVLAIICRQGVESIIGKPGANVPWEPYVKRVAPVGVASVLDIGFSNWGLELVRVSMYTMTKSSTIIFILMFSLVFKLERKSWKLVMIVFLIAGGLVMLTYRSPQFNLLGFLLVLLASFSSGVRWTLAQLLMQKSEMGLDNPLDMVYHVQPWMMLALLPIAALIEGPGVATSCRLFAATDEGVVFGVIFSVVGGGVIAFAMEVSEYFVVSYSSSLSLSIAGIFKEVCTLILAITFNGDQINAINVVGLVTCLGGIIAHIAHKAQTIHQPPSPVRNALRSPRDGHEMTEPLLLQGSYGSSSNYLVTSSDEDSEEASDILYILGQRDRVVQR